MEKRAFLENNISLLGFGIMRLPMVQGTDEIDVAQVTQMVDTAIKSGINYFDTAYPYHGGKSERVLKEVLVDRYDRSQYFLADKMPVWEVNEYADFDRLFNIQLERTGVDYFDFYLLHALSQDRHEKHGEIGMYLFMQELKASGRVKHIGFSFHDKPDALRQILTDQPEMEFVQLQINYLDWDAIGAGECYDIATEMGKPVIVMEPVKGGSLVNLPDKAKSILDALHGGSYASYAIRFAASFDGIMVVLSGMSGMEQLEDNIRYMKKFNPLSEAEFTAVNEVREILGKQDSIPCTACQYCTDGCPKHIPISDLFSCMNAKKQYQDWNSDWYYMVHTQSAGKASDCIKCGKCETSCPQHLLIMNLLEDVASVFEKRQ